MSANSTNLSKSRYLSGLQCKKKLYLDLYRPELRPPISADQQRLFDSGHEIGALAQTVFAGGKDASPETPGDFKNWLANTQEFLAAGVPVNNEAAFSADGGDLEGVVWVENILLIHLLVYPDVGDNGVVSSHTNTPVNRNPLPSNKPLSLSLS